ncbi:hypothetical protein [Homoserinimonas hongtaonis]|uniref:hypothetical protein n=1 Tax=Homoserinimonas hongtaonis TaxID=2079791 RepID=UPI00131EF478|nr:hypothetical protein [Salinibacterium hongtaonis]
MRSGERRMLRLPWARGAAWIVLVAAAAASSTACASAPPRGDSIAAEQAQQLAEEMGTAMTPPVIFSREADWFVVEHIAASNDPSRGIRVEALAWSGTSGSGDGAEIDVRITIDVPAHSATRIFEASYGPGSATRCYRYHVVGSRFYDTLKFDEIVCTNDAAPALPVPDPPPALPADAQATISRVLTYATSGSLAADLRVAFPQDFITVESDSVGEVLVAAVGVPSERECIVAVRGADGAIERVGFDPMWIEPGEAGCSTRLYTSPPL